MSRARDRWTWLDFVLVLAVGLVFGWWAASDLPTAVGWGELVLAALYLFGAAAIAYLKLAAPAIDNVDEGVRV